MEHSGSYLISMVKFEMIRRDTHFDWSTARVDMRLSIDLRTAPCVWPKALHSQRTGSARPVHLRPEDGTKKEKRGGVPLPMTIRCTIHLAVVVFIKCIFT